MTIGIPKALLYYKYSDLWINFFSYLNIDTIISPNTNKEILELGKRYSTDEACLSLKIFLGHVKYLVNKCEYVLIPRVNSLKKKESMCTNFSCIYDLVENTFNIKTLLFNIDAEKHEDELSAFIYIARELNIPKLKAIKKTINDMEKYKYIKQESILKNDKLKILVSGHTYNLNDNLIGTPIIKYLKDLDVTVITTDNIKSDLNSYKNISKDLYWTYSKEILSSIYEYKDKVDGIILISAFPCGPDSLCNEMVIRKIKDIPIITIIVDELNNDSGLLTRLESFVDILKSKKERHSIYEF